MDRLVFRPLRGQSPAVMLVATFAVAFLLQSIALLWFGSLGKIAASLAYLNRPVTIVERRHPQDHDRRASSSPSLCLARADASARADDDRPAHARRGDGLPDGPHARRARQPRDRGRGAALGRARRGRRGDAHRAEPARHARLRAARHDHRARGRRARRHEPADPGDARRVRDRLRERAARRRAADRTRASTCRRSSSPR